MEEEKSNARSINYSAIAEMAGTDGWKELSKMLEWDVKFFQGLLNRPKRQEATKDNPSPDQTWIIDLHEIGRARQGLATASKYLNLVETASKKSHT
jgi:hypothetical protein